MNPTLQIHVKPDQQVQQSEQEVELLAYRQKCAEQQRNWQKTQTPEKTQVYKQKDALRKQELHISETHEQSYERRKKNAEALRTARANEPDDVIHERGRKNAEQQRKKRENETDEQLLERRKNTERQRNARARQHELARDINRNHNHLKFIARNSLETFDESTVQYNDIGPMNNVCCECGALMFKGKNSKGKLSSNQATFSLCCSNGTIKLPPIKDPPEKST